MALQIVDIDGKRMNYNLQYEKSIFELFIHDEILQAIIHPECKSIAWLVD